MGDAGRRQLTRPRIRRRLRLMGLGLVLLPTLAVAVLTHGIFEAERQARARASRTQQERLQARSAELASTLARHPEIFPAQSPERFALGLDHPELVADVSVDASCNGWRFAEPAPTRPCDDGLVHYDRPEFLDRDTGLYDARDFSVAFVAARQAAYLHLYARVRDDQLAPRGRGLDEGDHLRLVAALPQPGGASIPRRFVVALGPEGDVTTYQVERNWRSEVPARERVAWGQYRLEIYRRPYGKWRQTADGYEIELRLPLRTLGPAWREAELGLGVVDVDVRPEVERGFRRQTMWVAPQREGAIALAAPRAQRFREALAALGLNLAGRPIAVFDARGRELTEQLLAPGHDDTALRERAAALLATARRGDPLPPSASAPLAAARVETREGELLGVVLERAARPPAPPALTSVLFELPTTAAAVAAALLLLFLLLGYTRRLSTRLLALVEDVGAERDADDEIGELSRRLSELVERDRAHRGYLEQLPRILGHETLGPLGVIKMALDELPAGDTRRDAAGRAIHAIEDLVEDLREATSLEEALQKGERIVVDLVDFVREYAAAYAEASGRALALELPEGSLRCQIIERRLDQLLDKLLDNAADFSDAAPVTLGLSSADGYAILRVENHGSQLPPDAAPDQLFAPMSSWRKRTTRRHLGLGLYVARVISEQHGGGIRAWNAGEDRVVFEVTLQLSPKRVE